MNWFARQKQRQMQRTNVWTLAGKAVGGGGYELGDWD